VKPSHFLTIGNGISGKLSICLIIAFSGLLYCGRHSSDFDKIPTRPASGLPVFTSSDSFYLNNYRGNAFIEAVTDHLLGEYVTHSRGLVAYDSLWSEGLLASLGDSIAAFRISSFSTREDSLAFFINSYNVSVIRGLQKYGASQTQEQLGFPLFNSAPFTIAGETVTLDSLEKGTRHIKRFNEPRTHFALVCAALSCPPLLNRAWRAATLYRDLDERTRLFLNDSSFNPVSASSVRVSQLFQWYAGDFSGKVRDVNSPTKLRLLPDGTEKDFIAGYLNDTVRKQAVLTLTLQFMNYDWTINSQ
jgi:hypothetical protein